MSRAGKVTNYDITMNADKKITILLALGNHFPKCETRLKILSELRCDLTVISLILNHSSVVYEHSYTVETIFFHDSKKQIIYSTPTARSIHTVVHNFVL